MIKIWPFVERAGGKYRYLRIKLRWALKDRGNINIRAGDTIFVEGGPGSGKSKFVEQTRNILDLESIPYVLLDANQPKSRWLAEFATVLPTKITNPEKRLEAVIERCLPEKYYLIVTNAEKITDAKLGVIEALIEAARSVIMTTRSYNLLHREIKAQLSDARLITLGTGRDTFDCTLILIGVLIIALAFSGYRELVFTVAAIRYLFQGIRTGGRPV